MLWIAALVGGYALVFVAWRYWYFFRDPERTPPAGDDVLAPADGFVVYTFPVRAGEVPVAVKGRRVIPLHEITALPGFATDGTLIGIFMTPLSVHVNRAPIGGIVRKRVHRATRKNRSMVRMFINLLLAQRPYAEDCRHIVENERNTLLIEGERLSVAVTQIADNWVSSVICRPSEGDRVDRGARYGMIRFGSQVDVFIPASPAIRVVCREGESVKAGESVLARVDPGP